MDVVGSAGGVVLGAASLDPEAGGMTAVTGGLAKRVPGGPERLD